MLSRRLLTFSRWIKVPISVKPVKNNLLSAAKVEPKYTGSINPIIPSDSGSLEEVKLDWILPRDEKDTSSGSLYQIVANDPKYSGSANLILPSDMGSHVSPNPILSSDMGSHVSPNPILPSDMGSHVSPNPILSSDKVSLEEEKINWILPKDEKDTSSGSDWLMPFLTIGAGAVVVGDSSDEEDGKPGRLFNERGRGLCYNDGKHRLVQAADFQVRIMGSIRDPQRPKLRGNIWALKSESSGSHFKIFVPKKDAKNPAKFEEYIDFQTEEECNITLGNRNLWAKFITSELAELTNLGANKRTFDFVYMLGCQLQNVDWTKPETEVYAFGPSSFYDCNGRLIRVPNYFWYPSLDVSTRAVPLFREIQYRPGTKELFAKFIRVATPFNFEAYNLGLAAAVIMLHGGKVRNAVGGQLPVTILKSENKEKSQGKSGCADAMQVLVSDPKTHNVDPETKIQQIKKIASRTSLPLYFSDVKSPSLVKALVDMRFDDTTNYVTAEGTFVPRAEFLISANYVEADERSGDRLMIIPFRSWDFLSSTEKMRLKKEFMSVVKPSKKEDQGQKPTEFTIGHMGKFFSSEEFLSRQTHYAQFLADKVEVVKPRTLENYAIFYAALEQIHHSFTDVWDEKGVTWEDFLKWSEDVHVPAIRRQHVEVDHAVNYCRRWVLGVLETTASWSITDRLKIMRIVKTQKISSSHALAIHPAKRYKHLWEAMQEAKLSEVRKFLEAPSVGGAPNKITGPDVAACLLSDHAEDGMDTIDTTDRLSTQTKRCVMFPTTLFTSAMLMRICDATNQPNYYTLGDAETPSGSDLPEESEDGGSSVSINRESTRLEQRDTRSDIESPEISKISEVDFSEREESGDDSDDVNNVSNEPSIEDIFEESEFGEDFFREVVSSNRKKDKAEKSKTTNNPDPNESKNKGEKEKGTKNRGEKEKGTKNRGEKEKGTKKTERETQISDKENENKKRDEDNEKTLKDKITNSRKNISVNTSARQINLFVCDDCGKTFTTQSAHSRHISWFLKRKKSCKEKNSSTTAISITSNNTVTNSLSTISLFPCDKCTKTCKSSSGLQKHVKSAHKEIDSSQLAIDDTDKSSSGLQKHVKSAHKEIDSSQLAINDTDSSKNRTVTSSLTTASFTCPHCPKTCSTAWNLKTHIKARHQEESEKDSKLCESENELSTEDKTKPVDGDKAVPRPRRRSIARHKAKASASKK